MSYASIIQGGSLTVQFDDGDVFTWPKTHVHFDEAKKAVSDKASATTLRSLMDTVSRIAAQIAPAASAVAGTITVTRDGVLYKGMPLHLTITDRIMAHVAEGISVDPLVRFLEKLMTNPSNSAVTRLYDFLEANSIPITDDGDFLTFKKVRGDYKDIHSGTFDNSVGQKPRVERWQVNEDNEQTCAAGLHVCARQYLPSFGSGSGDRVVITKVNPANVVAVPRDYNNSKMRVSEYEVIGELSDAQRAEIFDGKKIVRPGDMASDVQWGDNFQGQDSQPAAAEDEKVAAPVEEKKGDWYKNW